MPHADVKHTRYVGYGEESGNVDPVDEVMLSTMGSDGCPLDPHARSRELAQEALEEQQQLEMLQSMIRKGGEAS
jgi:hypothetical protein